MRHHFCLLSILLLLFVTGIGALELPLSTNSRWLVDQTGQRVKLACVNWPTHLKTAVAEGLSKRPVDEISAEISEMGFNCVRLTWPLFLFTDDTLAAVSVRESFLNVGLDGTVAGLQANNPSIVDLPLIDAYQAVVDSLAKNNVMIVLDNHVSRPGWCCSDSDGNGFFGDKDLDPNLWIKGLTKVATTFNNTKMVVAMSLRNELRGSRQNVKDWFRYMPQGAEAVHAANPNLLVILSGLNYDRDLSFLHHNPVRLSFSNKLMFELHWYGFSDGTAWETGNPNQVCGKIVKENMNRAGFLLDKGYPLFVSEFGVDMKGNDVNDNRFLDCFMGWAAEYDVDWAYWAVAGSYYLREGVVGYDESYGIYNWDWSEIRNQSMLQRISALQYPFKGPENMEAARRKIIFHPKTGLCVKRMSMKEPLVLGPCSEAEEWDYTTQRTLTIKGTNLCVRAQGLRQLANLSEICSTATSKWKAISDSMMHLTSKLENGRKICLDVDMNNIVTNGCKCLNRDKKCDPGSQWFKIIDSTRSNTDKKFFVYYYSIVKKIVMYLLGSFMI